MKPRLKSAASTAEDLMVWEHLVGRVALWEVYRQSRDSDRRDADLMLECQLRWRAGYRQSRAWMPYKGPLSIAWCGYLLECGGSIRGNLR